MSVLLWWWNVTRQPNSPAVFARLGSQGTATSSLFTRKLDLNTKSSELKNRLSKTRQDYHLSTVGRNKIESGQCIWPPHVATPKLETLRPANGFRGVFCATHSCMHEYYEAGQLIRSPKRQLFAVFGIVISVSFALADSAISFLRSKADKAKADCLSYQFTACFRSQDASRFLAAYRSPRVLSRAISYAADVHFKICSRPSRSHHLRALKPCSCWKARRWLGWQ